MLPFQAYCGHASFHAANTLDPKIPAEEREIFSRRSRQTIARVQGSAKEWSLGCAIPASYLPLAAGTCFTQPRDHSLADPCKSRSRRPISPAEQDLTKLGGREGDTHTCTLTPCTNLSHLNRTSRSSRIGGGESAAAGSRIVVPESRIRREDSEKVSRHRHGMHQGPFSSVRQECQKIRHREQFSLHAQMHTLLPLFSASPFPSLLSSRRARASRSRHIFGCTFKFWAVVGSFVRK